METSSHYLYTPNRIDTVGMGMKFQDFVVEECAKVGILIQVYTSKEKQLTKGESIQGYEIKLDNRWTDTKQLSIEVAEKRHPGIAVWSDSGIFRKDNAIFYVQGNYKGFFIFEKEKLKQLLTKNKYQIYEFNGTIKRFFVPVAEAIENSLLFVRPQDENEN